MYEFLHQRIGLICRLVLHPFLEGRENHICDIFKAMAQMLIKFIEGENITYQRHVKEAFQISPVTYNKSYYDAFLFLQLFSFFAYHHYSTFHLSHIRLRMQQNKHITAGRMLDKYITN